MDKGQIKIGFKQVTARSESSRGIAKSIRECSSCDSFYGDVEESCHDNSVTSYDLTIESSGRTYCTFWKPVGFKKKD